MKKTCKFLIFFLILFFGHLNLAYSYLVVDFSAIVIESYARYSSATEGHIYEGEIRRDGWGIGDSFNGYFLYDTFDYNEDGRGGEGSILSFLDLGSDYSRVSVTNDTIDTLTLQSTVSWEGGTTTIEIVDPTGTLVPGTSTDELPETLNLTNSELFDVEISYGYMYTGPADHYDEVRLRAIGYIKPVPLPSAIFLYGFGLIGLAAVVRRSTGLRSQRI